MFNVHVSFEKEYSDSKLKEVQTMYAETRDYGEVCMYFDDFGLCDEAMLSWAIDLGWDIDSILKETANILSNNLYSNDDSRCNFFSDIVNEAIGFIESHLPIKTSKEN